MKDRSKWYSAELKLACFNMAFDEAPKSYTKERILAVASSHFRDIERKGEDFIKHLFYATAREGLKMMTYGAKPSDYRTFRQLLQDFNKDWGEHPEMHKAKVLAEYL